MRLAGSEGGWGRRREGRVGAPMGSQQPPWPEGPNTMQGQSATPARGHGIGFHFGMTNFKPQTVY
eukprot:1958702-Pyramimonas_sp.AAC.1